jgi:predicted phage terminase large subunit-like protein
VKLHSADSAIIGISFDRESRAIYIRDVDAGKFYPEELYDKAIDMVERIRARIIAPEVTSLNEFITQPFLNQLKLRGCWAQFVELKARMKKEDRISALVPYYRQGFVFHNKSCCQKLESQLLSYPRSRLWDVMDAEAYIIELMELEGQYFDPPDIPEDDESYFDLENDGIIKDWRLV